MIVTDMLEGPARPQMLLGNDTAIRLIPNMGQKCICSSRDPAAFCVHVLVAGPLQIAQMLPAGRDQGKRYCWQKQHLSAGCPRKEPGGTLEES